MKTVVFVDELLLVNFAAAAALLLGAGLLCGRSCTGLRLCAGSAAAAVSTLVLLAPPWPAPLAVLYKIASCCGVVAVCYGVAGVRSFARLCGWYAALNGLLCGAVVLPGVQANNLNVLLPVRPGQLLLCCAGVYGLLRGLLAVFGRPQRGCFAAVLQIAGATVPVQAYHDTGFTLQDPLAGRRVVLVQYPPVRSRLPAPLRAYLDSWFAAGTAPPPGLRVQFVETLYKPVPALPFQRSAHRDPSRGNLPLKTHSFIVLFLLPNTMARLLRYAPAREHTPHDPYFTIIVHFPVRNKNLKAKSPAKSKKLSKQGF